MAMKMVDVLVHLDETAGHDQREGLEDQLRDMDGVVAATSHDDKPHLLMVEYDPDRVSSAAILAQVKASGLHAEIVGL